MLSSSHFLSKKTEHHAEEGITKEEQEKVVAKSKPVAWYQELEPETIAFVGFGCFIHHRGSRNWFGTLFSQALRYRCGTKLKTQQQLLKSGAGDDNPFSCTVKSVAGDKSGVQAWWNSARNSESSYKDEVGLPKSWSLWWSVRCDTSWTKVQWEFDSLREQQLRCSQYVGSWITQRLILNQHHEILNVSTIEWRFTPWMKSTLLHDKVIKWADAKVHVYSNSVLCLVRMHGHPEAKEKWKDPFQLLQQSNGCWELFGMENQLSSSGIFDRTYHIGASQSSEDFQWQVIFMSMLTTSIGQRQDIAMNAFRILKRWKFSQKDFRWDIGLSSVQEKKEIGMERTIANLKDRGYWLRQMSW